MKFLVDRCAGRRLADWLRTQGHDVLDASGAGPDPGDVALLARSAAEQRVLITIDTDFGTLVYRARMAHAGLIRLPDIPATRRIEIVQQLLSDHADAMAAGAVITVRSGRIRVSLPPR